VCHGSKRGCESEVETVHRASDAKCVKKETITFVKT